MMGNIMTSFQPHQLEILLITQNRKLHHLLSIEVLLKVLAQICCYLMNSFLLLPLASTSSFKIMISLKKQTKEQLNFENIGLWQKMNFEVTVTLFEI